MIDFSCRCYHKDRTPIVKDLYIQEYAEALLADYRPDLLTTPGKIDAFQSDAVQESTVFNPGDPFRQGDVNQAPAAGEGTPADGFQARRKLDSIQCGTVVKGALPDGSDRFRKKEFPETCTVLERLFRDGSD